MATDTLTQVLNLLNSSLPGRAGVAPETATPFVATNQTLVDGTTARTVKAAVTGKKHWITRITVLNVTAAENTVTNIQDTTGTPIVLATLNAPSQVVSQFTPLSPIEVGAGLAINAAGVAATGDVRVTIEGFVEA